MTEGPAPAPLRIDASVVSNSAEGGAHRLTLAVEGWPGSLPGQFVMLSPGIRGSGARTDPLLPRPMAVYRTRRQPGGEDWIDILYKVTGRGTALLADARGTERIALVGPLGGAFPNPPPDTSVLLVGGGTGIASLYELAACSARHCRVEVLLGARTENDLMGQLDFEALDVELRLCTEDGSAGETGLVTELLERRLEDEPDARVYACGPTPMMRRAAEISLARGASCWVSLENTMACGFGVCLGCAVPDAAGGFALVCRDGPVFDARRIDWDGLP